MEPGEVPTVQLMCVRTEPSAYKEAPATGERGETDSEDLAAAAAHSAAASTAGKVNPNLHFPIPHSHTHTHTHTQRHFRLHFIILT